MRTVLWALGVLLIFSRSAIGYGDKVDTLLNWQERAVAVLTNACRMAPITYRDRFIGNSGILLPGNYPAVAPLYWNRELNAAARFHCVEMALDCGMTHTCNGVEFGDRLREFYKKSGYIGENIAAGYRTPQDVVNGWLIDGQSVATAAPDGNGDGHRANIMSSRFTELGCGYFLTGTGRSATGYWCQDFGGGRSDYSYHPVYAASHLFYSSDSITFMVNLYDVAETVATLTLLLEGDRLPFVPTMGSAHAGTWEITVPVATSCRVYSVEAAFTDGHTLKYPEEGMLTTVGEGSCTETDSGSSVSMRWESTAANDRMVSMHRFNNHLEFTAKLSRPSIVSTELLDCLGRIHHRYTWRHPSGLSVPLRMIPEGVCLMRHRYSDGTVYVARWVNR
ncbi:MAG: CAP domain-containing protein [Chitinispirillaceae bacterium]|nr:CAP domain-containing protein [Chitinispirillaceae bacterium]